MTSELIQRALETATDTKSIVAGRGVVNETGRVFTECFGDAHAIIVADENTWAAAGEAVEYVPRDGLGEFDLVLSYTGGGALDALRTRLGARRVAPLY